MYFRKNFPFILYAFVMLSIIPGSIILYMNVKSTELEYKLLLTEKGYCKKTDDGVLVWMKCVDNLPR
jgi:hypothetical protein